MPRPLEHHDGQVAHVLTLGPRHAAQIVQGGGHDVDGAAGLGPDGDLAHIHDGAGVEHAAAVGQRDGRQRVGLAQRQQPGAVDRVYRDIDLGLMAGAQHLAVVQHRRFVFLALADDHHPVHLNRVEHQPHSVHGGAVAGFLVGAAHKAAGGQRRGLGHAHQLQRQVTVGSFRHSISAHHVRAHAPARTSGIFAPVRSSGTFGSAPLLARQAGEQPHKIVAHRAGYQPRVHPVQRAAVAGHERPGIFDAHLPLEHGHAQVAQRAK